MSESFLSRRQFFGIPNALLILLVFFFLLPSAFRGARFAIAEKKNNIKDWLPSDFQETVELDWFAKYFVGESFVVGTWDGCTPDDQRLQLLVTKLRRESVERDLSKAPADVARARELAEKLQLFVGPKSMTNWGGQNEIWFSSPSGKYYYLTPSGHFYRWQNESNVVGGISRTIKRALGRHELQGTFITALGQEEGGTNDSTHANPYYNEPTLLAASLFQSIRTGNDFVNQLAAEGGPLWPVDLTDASQREAVARSRAIERLTGTLFAPAVPENFAWTPEAVHDHLPPKSREKLPADFDYRVRSTVQSLTDQYGGTIESLHHLTLEEQATAWATLCKSLEIELPPRQTCVMATLTPFGKDHLPHAVGRGVLGGARGRILLLADQSGIVAAGPPSMAPPPFDQPENQATDPSGRAMLRLGGPPVDNVAIDEEGTVTLVRLVGYSGLIGVLLSYFCFRSIKVTIMVFMVGVASAVLSLATTQWTGGHVDAILMSMPSLVYVSGLSSAIHIVNYYRDETKLRGREGAAMRAAKHAFMPCFLSAFTTAIGLWSLCASNLVPIRNFGLYAGIAIMTTMAVLYIYLPAALETFAPYFSGLTRKDDRPQDAEDTYQSASEATPKDDWIGDIWEAGGRFIAKHHAIVSISFLLVFAISFVGLFRIKTSVQLLKLFDSESRIIADYGYLESNFGKLVPMELVVRMPPSMQSEKVDAIADKTAITEPVGAVVSKDQKAAMGTEFKYPLTLLERIEAVGRIDTVVRRALGESGTGVIGKTMSAVTFLPPLPEPSNNYSPTRARFLNQLSESLDGLEDTDCFRREKTGPRIGSELWRISLRVGALSDVDYGRFVHDLRLTVTPVVDAYRTREQILSKLDELRAKKKVADSPRVLFIGHAEPLPLREERLVSIRTEEAANADRLDTKSLIRAEDIYAATLMELMLGEKIKRPVWIDPDSDTAKIRPGDAKWEKLLETVDCVVLVGESPSTTAADLQKHAQTFVDGRLAMLPIAQPSLQDNVPVELHAGPLETVYTGIVPVVYKAQRTLLVSLVESMVMAFFLIAGVMCVLLIPGYFPWAYTKPKLLGCGIAAGFIAMLPNLFPVVVVFGFMGHGNVLVDIGTMMTASVALGVAVDDTIHFLTWFRDHLDSGMTRLDAVIATYRRVGPAMMQTTLVGGLGLFVFSLSTFTPTQRFGVLMLVMLATALAGDLILLPALLAGPLGRWFRPRQPSPNSNPPVTLATTSDELMEDVSSSNEAVITAKHASQPHPPTPKAMNKPTRRSHK